MQITSCGSGRESLCIGEFMVLRRGVSLQRQRLVLSSGSVSLASDKLQRAPQSLPQPGPGSPFGSPVWAGRDPRAWTTSCCLPGPLAGSWSEAEVGRSLQNSGPGCRRAHQPLDVHSGKGAGFRLSESTLCWNFSFCDVRYPA